MRTKFGMVNFEAGEGFLGLVEKSEAVGFGFKTFVTVEGVQSVYSERFFVPFLIDDRERPESGGAISN